MPSRIELAENLWLLYICLQNSDYKAIDFNAVGEITNLKPPAARMRFTRLRRAIEDGTLIDTHGKHFQGSADKIAEAQKKRKKPSSEDADCNGDDEEPVPPRPKMKVSRSPGARYEADSCNAFTSEAEIDSPECKLMDTEYKTYAIEKPSSDPTTKDLGCDLPPTDVSHDVEGGTAEGPQGDVLPTVALLSHERCKQRDTLLGPVEQNLAIRPSEDSPRI